MSETKQQPLDDFPFRLYGQDERQQVMAWFDRHLQEGLREAHAQLEGLEEVADAETTRREAEVERLRTMIRDECIDHSDACRCPCCKEVFRIDAALQEKP